VIRTAVAAAVAGVVAKYLTEKLVAYLERLAKYLTEKLVGYLELLWKRRGGSFSTLAGKDRASPPFL
jgi:hypothetical protein